MNYLIIKINTLEDADKIAKICEKYDEDIDFIVGRYIIDGKSYLGILSIGFDKNIKVIMHSNNYNKINNFYNKLKTWEVTNDISR